MFLWMSVMCFDICWTFVRARMPRRGSDRTRFCLYSMFAWGAPALLVAAVAAIDLSESVHVEVKPGIGKTTCFMTIEGQRFYFSMPILVLLSFNTVMFIVTVATLWRSSRQSRQAGIARISKRDTTVSTKLHFA
jgi:hypothetical protein